MNKRPRTKRKRSKYRNIKVTYFGIQFDSKKEGARYLVLRKLEEEGRISDLQLQVKFPLHSVTEDKVADYICDFAYNTQGTSCFHDDIPGEWKPGTIIEDVKGVRTAVYRLKKKLFESEYGIDIKET